MYSARVRNEGSTRVTEYVAGGQVVRRYIDPLVVGGPDAARQMPPVVEAPPTRDSGGPATLSSHGIPHAPTLGAVQTVPAYEGEEGENDAEAAATESWTGSDAEWARGMVRNGGWPANHPNALRYRMQHPPTAASDGASESGSMPSMAPSEWTNTDESAAETASYFRSARSVVSGPVAMVRPAVALTESIKEEEDSDMLSRVAKTEPYEENAADERIGRDESTMPDSSAAVIPMRSLVGRSRLPRKMAAPGTSGFDADHVRLVRTLAGLPPVGLSSSSEIGETLDHEALAAQLPHVPPHDPAEDEALREREMEDMLRFLPAPSIAVPYVSRLVGTADIEYAQKLHREKQVNEQWGRLPRVARPRDVFPGAAPKRGAPKEPKVGGAMSGAKVRGTVARWKSAPFSAIYPVLKTSKPLYPSGRKGYWTDGKHYFTDEGKRHYESGGGRKPK